MKHTTRTPGFEYLMFNFSLGGDCDAWGDVMNWWFCAVEELYWKRVRSEREKNKIRQEFMFRPSPLGYTNTKGEFPTDVVADKSVTKADLWKFARFLKRYAHVLKKAGKDY